MWIQSISSHSVVATLTHVVPSNQKTQMVHISYQWSLQMKQMAISVAKQCYHPQRVWRKTTESFPYGVDIIQQTVSTRCGKSFGPHLKSAAAAFLASNQEKICNGCENGLSMNWARTGYGLIYRTIKKRRNYVYEVWKWPTRNINGQQNNARVL